MRFKYLVNFLLLLLLILIFSSQKVSAYSTEAHLALTQGIIKFYNLHFSDKPITQDMVSYLIDGSRREDDPPRWMNHFYDPIYNRGLTNPFLGNWQKSKDWAQDPKNQTALKYNSIIATLLSSIQTGKIQKFFPTSDFTWQRALKYYLDGDQEMAMFTLGHILHLIEDAATPDHTRNDAHPEGSPYEIYTKQFTTENLDSSKFLKNKKPVLLNDLNSYFDEIADYSNKNFYSKDTIGIQSGYKLPEPDYFQRDGSKIYGFKVDREFGDYHLIKASSLFAWAFNGSELINHPFIMSDYWDRLSIKTIQYSAGVINLFFQEAEKSKNNPDFLQAKSKSFLAQTIENISNFFSNLIGNGNNFQLLDQASLDNKSQNSSPNQQLLDQPAPIQLCSSKNSKNPTHQGLIINEVAWMGSVGSANDEWIELKNISRETIDISGWQLIDQKEQIKVVFNPGAKLSANSFYLLERNGDETIPQINADLIYKGSLANTDETLRLFDKNCNLIDEILANPNWPAGDNTQKRSMERSLDLTWHTYSGNGSKGIFGTPKAENSQPKTTETKKDNKTTPQTEINYPTSTENSAENQNNQTGNSLLCTFNTSKIPNRQKLIINEVAWMGTTDSANNEWIELKNISGANLDISGWQLIDQGEQIKINFPSSSVIPANGFYLLERTDDNTVPNMTADYIYTGALSNTNEGLRIFDNQCNLIDEILANPDWPAGNNSERKTLERDLSGFGWHTSSIVNGTPKKENSSPAVSYSGGGGSGSGSPSNNNSSQQENQTPPTVCSQENLGSPLHSVLINEVAWAGTSSSTTADEWIELKNNSDQSVNLSGWQLLNKDNTLKVFFDNNDILNSGAYYLLERSDDNSVPGITADKIFTNAIKNSGELLRLFNQNCQLVDEVSAESNWPAGIASPDYRTAERAADFSWYSYNGSGENGIMGTPKADNSQNQPQAAQNQNGNLNPESAIISNVNHVIISEIMAGESGAANSEFIELYNPTNQTIDLSNWSLKRKTTFTATTTQNLVSSSGFNSSINPRGFFLIASKTYGGGKTPDLSYSQISNHLAQDEDVLLLYDSQSNTVDEVSYESIIFGQSLERKAFQNNSCLSAQNEGEFLGNGCDTDNFSDFEIRSIPNPQNSSNLPEPRSAPTAVQNFNIQYHSSIPTLNFSWDQSTAAISSSIIYEIREGSSSVLTATTTALEFSKNIDEVGKNYNFSIRAFDQEGLGSEIKTAVVSVPSFLKSFYFYPDSSSTPPQYSLEFSYDNYPFVPGYFDGGGNGSWRVLIFYYNQEAPKTLVLGPEDWGKNLTDTGALQLNYPHCAGADAHQTSLILPDSTDRCSANYGGIRNSSLRWDQLEDLHLLINVDPASFTEPPSPEDYLTIAFYAYSGFNEQKLVAVDAQKYYFQNSAPVNQPATAPANLSAEYNTQTSVLNLSWVPATDPDDLDRNLIYEINYNSAPESCVLTLDENSWTAINLIAGSDPNLKYAQLPVSPNTFYLIGLRAKDPKGNISEPTLLNFTTPVVPPPFGLSDIHWGHLNNLDNPESIKLTFEFENYPFIPDGGWPWSAMVFYLNQDPPNDYRFEVAISPFSAVASAYSRLSLNYQGCSEPARDSGGLILPRYDGTPCYSWGGLRAAALQYSQIQMPSEEQKGKITIGVNGEFSISDYITIGFYASGNYSKQFEPVGVDKNKYYFEP